MAFQNLPIKRKVMAVIMLTSVVALLLTTTAFMVYDFLSYRQTLVRTLSTTSSIIADESTAALAFKNESDAQQILGALKADSHIVAAALAITLVVKVDLGLSRARSKAAGTRDASPAPASA